MISAFLGMILAWGGGNALATTCTWDANLTVATLPGYESAALDLTWTPVTNCGTFTFSNYRVCWNRSGTAPDEPDEADRCAPLGGPISKADADFFVHWSSTQHSVRLFACDRADDDCADHFGSFVDEDNSDDVGTVTTAQEIWVIEDVNSYSDTSRTVSDSSANAAGAFYYSAGTHDGKLGLWWSTSVSTRETIRYNRPSSTGWKNFNNHSSWQFTMSAGATVAVEPDTGSSGKFRDCTHPWVVPTYDSTTRGVRMQVHCGASSDTEIYRIDSVDEAGSDFGLECLGSCAADGIACPTGDMCDWDDDDSSGGAAVLDICSDETLPACFYLNNSGHGKYIWGSLFGDYVDFGSDTPVMVFTGSPGSGADCDGFADDIYTATWNPGSATWSVPYVTSPKNCPTITITDRHDPGILPLPFGEAKMYLQSGLTEFQVYHSDGTTWFGPSAITIGFDDGSGGYSLGTPSLHTCLENIEIIIYHDGQTGFEGAFFKANTGSCFSAGGILFAEHRN